MQLRRLVQRNVIVDDIPQLLAPKPMQNVKPALNQIVGQIVKTAIIFSIQDGDSDTMVAFDQLLEMLCDRVKGPSPLVRNHGNRGEAGCRVFLDGRRRIGLVAPRCICSHGRAFRGWEEFLK